MPPSPLPPPPSLHHVCITVDYEPDCPPYLDSKHRGIEEGTAPLLALFEEEGVRGTFFTTSDVAHRYPDAVHAVVRGGHELGCHGATHRAFSTLGLSAASWEIETSAAVLRTFAPVTSFRAPYLRFPDAYLPVLEANRFLVDSSQAKYKPEYYEASRPTRLTRIAASVTSSVLRLPRWIRDPWLAALSSPVVLFVHPWEFVDLTKERLRLDCRFKTGKPALKALREVIHLFRAKEANFERMDRIGAALRATRAAVATGPQN